MAGFHRRYCIALEPDLPYLILSANLDSTKFPSLSLQVPMSNLNLAAVVHNILQSAQHCIDSYAGAQSILHAQYVHLPNREWGDVTASEGHPHTRNHTGQHLTRCTATLLRPCYSGFPEFPFLSDMVKPRGRVQHHVDHPQGLSSRLPVPWHIIVDTTVTGVSSVHDSDDSRSRSR